MQQSWEAGSRACERALNQLRGNPETFLRNNFLSINPTVFGNNQHYYLYIPTGFTDHYRPGKIRGMKKLHKTGQFKIDHQLPDYAADNYIDIFADVFKMNNGYDGTQNTLTVMQNHCVRLDREPTLGHLMFTGRLSGCSVIIKDNPRKDHIKCYHYKVNSVGTRVVRGFEMENNLRSHPLFQRNSVIYGADPINGGYDSARNKVNIIGVYQTTGWNIYAQIYLIKDENNMPLIHPVIYEVKRIYPT